MIAFASIALLALFLSVSIAAPEGFDDREVLRGDLGYPTAFDWTPDGKMIVARKRGQVILFDPTDDDSFRFNKVVLDLSDVICDNSERGLGGLRLHHDFENKRCMYVYYTFNKNGNCKEDPYIGPVNRLSRFWLTEDYEIESEDVFFDTKSLEYDHHNSGDIDFGKDGLLYVTVGDGGSTFSGVAADHGNLLGSVIRLTEDGAVPPENPFTFESGEQYSVRCNENGVAPKGYKCQEIYALGLRNPWRFAMDPNTEEDKVRFYINDVGQSKWEWINEGGTDFAGANYGWPTREGPCPNSKVKGCDDDHPFMNPAYYYIHENNSGAVTGGAFVPNGVFSSEYDGCYLYADYVFGHIYLLQKDNGEGECRSCDPPKSYRPVTEFSSFERIITMRFGPYKGTQALYYSSTRNDGTIRRISYAGDGNRVPLAVITTDATSGPERVQIKFNADESSDMDNDSLTYEWDLDGDGIIDSTQKEVWYRYFDRGVYKARLTVRDDQGGSNTVYVQISVGTPPIPVIESPQENPTFAVGDIITLQGSAIDENNDPIPARLLTWEVRQHHDTHFHPFLKKTHGNNIVLQPAPEPEDYDAADSSSLEVIMTATDADGLSTTVSRFVYPRMVHLEFITEPPGLELHLDGTPILTPAIATTWEGHELKVDARNQLLGTTPYTWTEWSDGGAQTHSIKILPSFSNIRPTFYAKFEEFDGTWPESTQPAEPQKCLPGFLGLIAKEKDLFDGETYYNGEFDVHVAQWRNGNLIVRQGTPENPGDTVWQTGVNETPEGDFFSRVQGDSNFMTYRGTPNNRRGRVFVTGTNGIEGDYFFGIDCTGTVVGVWQGRFNNPGKPVWTSGPLPVQEQPTQTTPTRPQQTGSTVPQPTDSNPTFSEQTRPEVTHTVPFDASALDFYMSRDSTPEEYGNCNADTGSVDAEKTSDEVCKSRGRDCTVYATTQGEQLVYKFYSDVDTVDITLRVASQRTDKRIRAHVDGVTLGHTWRGPGDGFWNFKDFHWKDVKISPGQRLLSVEFLDGQVNLCAVSVKPSVVSTVTQCIPAPILLSDEYVWSRQWKSQPHTDAYIYQQNDGIVYVRKGTFDNPGGLVWRSDINMDTGDYYTKLQKDGQLITRPGSALRGGSSYIWKSGVTGVSDGEYFLGLNCDLVSISVYRGTPDEPGEPIWTSPALFNVPFHASALDFTDFVEIDMPTDGGNCNIGPVEGKVIEDDVCNSRGSWCTIAFTRSGEELEYAFANDSDQPVDIMLRVSSSEEKVFFIEIDGMSGGRTFRTLDLGWDNYQDYVWENLFLPRGRHALKVKFIDGQVNLCSVSISTSTAQAVAQTRSSLFGD